MQATFLIYRSQIKIKIQGIEMITELKIIFQKFLVFKRKRLYILSVNHTKIYDH